jgi:hypothetical protein
LASKNLDVCNACDPLDSNIQLTIGKDWRWLLPPHLDVHLEVFIPKKKKEIAENITSDFKNLKTQNLRTSGSGVFPNPRQKNLQFQCLPEPTSKNLRFRCLLEPASKNLRVSQKTWKFSRQLFNLFKTT